MQDFRSLARQYIFPGESGGDYGALYGYSNRPGGQFENVDLTNMTVDQAIGFSNPSGPYARYVKNDVGHVATPMGAYQVVGSTLQSAKQGLGLRGDEPFNQATQDRVGQWIYENQGPSAWAGWGKGGGGQAPAATASTRGQGMRMSSRSAPQQQQEKKPFFQRDSTRNVLDNLAIGLQGMTLNPNQAMIQGAQQRIADRRETQQTRKQQNRTIEALRQAGVPDKDLQIAMSNPDYMRALLGQVAQSRMGGGGEQTAAGQNWATYNRILQEQGPEAAEQFLKFSGGQNINVNTGSEVGTIPKGYELFTDPETGARRLRPIAGGPAEQEQQALEEQEEGRARQTERAGSTVIQDLQRARDLIPELGYLSQNEGIVGGTSRTMSAEVPGTVANRITQFTSSALSNVGLDTLQQMRENSPTGGALGQVPIQQQKRLEQVLGSLEINQPPSVLDANLRRVMNIYTDIIHGDAAERAEAVREGRMSPEQNERIESYYFELPFDERGRKREDGKTRLKYNPDTGDFE